MEKKNTHLLKAKLNKNDEFYTRYEDIEKELENYKDFLENKVIYCNCDKPSYPNKSNFCKYFEDNFERLKLKKVIFTFFNNSNNFNNPNFLNELNDLNNLNKSYKVEIYNNDLNKKIIKTSYFKGTGSFDDKACIEILKRVDMVITNPPFSLFDKFIDQCMRFNKKFLIIGNKNAMLYKNIFPHFMNNEIWLGMNNVNNFYQPDGKMKSFGNVGWFTNIENNRRNSILELNKEYKLDKTQYPTFLNYEAINVSKVKDIPKDYEGVMAVPLSFIDSYNPNQFKIIGAGMNSYNEILGIEIIGSEVLKKYKEQGGTGHYTENMHSLVYEKDGKIHFPFKRIIIKKIK